MLQVMVHGPGEIRLDEIEAPRCGSRDVLVNVTHCGICGTDLAYVAAGGVFGLTSGPMALGHEICGRVAAVGEAVEDIPVGLHVAVNPMAAFNMIGNGGPEGGFTQTLRVRNACLGDTLHALPPSFTGETGALVEPLAVGIHAVNLADVHEDEPVVVIGAGAIGLAVVAALRARGVDDVVVVDLSKPRLERAVRLGARAAVDSGREDFFDAIAALQGTDYVFGQPVLATRVYIDAAGVPGPIETIVRSAGFGARLVIAGVHKHDVPIDLRMVLARELRIQGAIGYPNEFPAAIAALESGAIDADVMISHRFALSEFAEALAMARKPQEAGKVMITMEAS